MPWKKKKKNRVETSRKLLARSFQQVNTSPTVARTKPTGTRTDAMGERANANPRRGIPYRSRTNRVQCLGLWQGLGKQRCAWHGLILAKTTATPPPNTTATLTHLGPTPSSGCDPGIRVLRWRIRLTIDEIQQ